MYLCIIYFGCHTCIQSEQTVASLRNDACDYIPVVACVLRMHMQADLHAVTAMKAHVELVHRWLHLYSLFLSILCTFIFFCADASMLRVQVIPALYTSACNYMCV